VLSLAMVIIVLMAVGCTSSSECEETGTLVLNLTDAPVDGADIYGVYIAINKIEVNKSTGDNANWETIKTFDEPEVYNLLDLTGGEIAQLGEFELTAGQYNQIRFILNIQEQGQGPPANPGCYVQFDNEEGPTEPLFVPSGGQTGYKAVGAFEVPFNGETEVTIDFDLRKALHVTGEGQNQRYILKPTLRLVVDSQAGNIDGTITLDANGYTDIVVFAYEDGEWNTSEADEPAEGESRFPNAVTSDRMDDDDNSYILAYLAYGTYDLVVAGYNGDTFHEVLGTVSDVVLDSNHTLQNIDAGDLE